MHAFQCLGAVDLFEQFKLKKQRFEIRAGEPPVDAAHPAGQLQAARMLGGRLKQAVKTRAQVGCAADVGLGVSFAP